MPTNLQNFTQKDLTKMKIFQKVLGGLFFETPRTYANRRQQHAPADRVNCMALQYVACCYSYGVGRTTRRHPVTSSRIFFILHLFSPRSCHRLSTAERRLSMLFFFSQENIFLLFHRQLQPCHAAAWASNDSGRSSAILLNVLVVLASLSLMQLTRYTVPACTASIVKICQVSRQ